MQTEESNNSIILSDVTNVNQEMHINKLTKGAAESAQLDTTTENFPMNIQSKETLFPNEDNSIIMTNSFCAAVGKKKSLRQLP